MMGHHLEGFDGENRPHFMYETWIEQMPTEKKQKSQESNFHNKVLHGHSSIIWTPVEKHWFKGKILVYVMSENKYNMAKQLIRSLRNYEISI